MGRETIEGRVRTLESQVSIMFGTVSRIEQYMKDGVELRVQNTRDITEIKGCVLDFRSYQKGCDTERGEHGKRIEGLEKDRAYSRGAIATIIFVLGWLGFKSV